MWWLLIFNYCSTNEKLDAFATWLTLTSFKIVKWLLSPVFEALTSFIALTNALTNYHLCRFKCFAMCVCKMLDLRLLFMELADKKIKRASWWNFDSYNFYLFIYLSLFVYYKSYPYSCMLYLFWHIMRKYNSSNSFFCEFLSNIPMEYRIKIVISAKQKLQRNEKVFIKQFGTTKRSLLFSIIQVC